MNKILHYFAVLLLFTLISSANGNYQNVQSFVERFYVTILDRQPDNAGLSDWTNKLIAHERTGATLAEGFIFSDEFTGKPRSNESYVTTLYRAFFNREPDSTGFNGWVSDLNNGSKDRAEVLNGFLYSGEFKNLSDSYGIQAYEGAPFTSPDLEAFVRGFYEVVLGRTPAGTEVTYWTDKLSTGESTGSDIAHGFVFSGEYNEASKSNTAFLTTLYQAFFNRAPDTNGMNYWLNKIAGGMDRVTLLEKFLQSAEFVNLTNRYGILAYRGAPIVTASNNISPVANAGSDINVFGGKRVTLDASSSYDTDGRIIEYIWKEGDTVLGNGNNLSYLFGDGVHTITLTVRDNLGASDTASITITAECMMARAINVATDVTDNLNTQGSNDKESMCYSVDLSSNNSIETYTFYMNFYEGTIASVYYNSRKGDLHVELKDENAQNIKTFTTVRTKKDANTYEQFEIASTGKYFFILQRNKSETVQNTPRDLPVKYAFSIQPSNENGLQHNFEGELNDFKNMATKIDLSTAQRDVNGTLNYDRVLDSSMKHTDQSDYYEINFDKTGIFTLYMNFYEGTIASRYYNSRKGDVHVELKDENDQVIKIFTTVRTKKEAFSYEQFQIPSVGKYYLSLKRKYGESDSNNNFYALVAKYGFSIQPSNNNGLIHSAEGELNDFESMATRITLNDINNEINGTLNYDRARNTSLKNTDQYDYYEIDFDQVGTFTFNMNFYTGTIASVYYNSRKGDVHVELKDSLGRVVKIFTTVRTKNGATMQESFAIPSSGKYYLKLERIYREYINPNYVVLPVKYGIKITR